MTRPRVLAHRGASGYAYENSLTAFQQAVTLGADGVELDIHSTRDGALLVHHDAELPGRGPIAHLTLAETRRSHLPNGEPIPTLEEVLVVMGDRDVWVEVKSLTPTWDDRVFETLERGPCPERYGVHSFDHRIIARLGAQRPNLRRGVLTVSYLLDPLGVLRATGATVLWQEIQVLDEALISLIHDSGYTVIAWTVNRDRDAERLIHLGVDGLCGNFPDRLRAAVQRFAA